MVFRTCVCVCVVGSLRFVRMGQSNGHVIKQLCWRSDRKWDKRNELRHQFSSWQNTYSWTHCRIIIAYYVFFFLPAVVAASFATCAIVCVCLLGNEGATSERKSVRAVHFRHSHPCNAPFSFLCMGMGFKKKSCGPWDAVRSTSLLLFFFLPFSKRSLFSSIFSRSLETKEQMIYCTPSICLALQTWIFSKYFCPLTLYLILCEAAHRPPKRKKKSPKWNEDMAKTRTRPHKLSASVLQPNRRTLPSRLELCGVLWSIKIVSAVNDYILRWTPCDVKKNRIIWLMFLLLLLLPLSDSILSRAHRWIVNSVN